LNFFDFSFDLSDGGLQLGQLALQSFLGSEERHRERPRGRSERTKMRRSEERKTQNKSKKGRPLSFSLLVPIVVVWPAVVLEQRVGLSLLRLVAVIGREGTDQEGTEERTEEREEIERRNAKEKMIRQRE
jgi:hypothetical protein